MRLWLILVIVLLFACQATGATAVAQWKLDEQSGTNIVDNIGTNDGTWAGTGAQAITPAPSPSGSGLLFDNAADAITVGQASAINNIWATPATFVAWIDTDTSGVVLAWKTQWFIATALNDIRFRQTFDGDDGQWITNTDAISTDGWIHFAVVYDGSSTANVPIMYVNGVVVAQTEETTPTGTIDADAANDFFIGNLNALSQGFDGSISDVRIYDTALTSAEIAGIMNTNDRRSRRMPR